MLKLVLDTNITCYSSAGSEMGNILFTLFEKKISILTNYYLDAEFDKHSQGLIEFICLNCNHEFTKDSKFNNFAISWKAKMKKNGLIIKDYLSSIIKCNFVARGSVKANLRN